MSPNWPDTVDLASDTWVIEAQWGPRADDLANCTERLLSCLRALADLDPHLAAWTRDGEPVPLDEPTLSGLLEKGWDREDPSGQIGTTVSLWNGDKDDLASATLAVSCGFHRRLSAQ